MNSVHDIDLNLLRALCAVHRTGSVTRSAVELGVTQSAVSHALRRLRDQLGDPLFVRVGRRMEATPLGARVAERVGAHLHAITEVLQEPDVFDPATSRRRFTLASVDLFDVLMLPRLAATLGACAPGVALAVRTHDAATVRRFDRGELDAAVHPVLVQPSDDPLPTGGLRRRTLLRNGFSLYLRVDHPDGAAISADVDAFCAASHLLVGPDGGPGVVDRELSRIGRARRVALRVASFAATLPVVAHSDLVLVAPSSLARVPAPGVQCWPTPLPLPEHRVTLVWPERLHTDPGHRWFRERIVEAVR